MLTRTESGQKSPRSIRHLGLSVAVRSIVGNTLGRSYCRSRLSIEAFGSIQLRCYGCSQPFRHSLGARARRSVFLSRPWTFLTFASFAPSATQLFAKKLTDQARSGSENALQECSQFRLHSFPLKTVLLWCKPTPAPAPLPVYFPYFALISTQKPSGATVLNLDLTRIRATQR